MHVNSIWQRLRRNLLLFLQLLLLLLAILACLRPGVRGNKLTDDRLVFMIDTSASMSATDVQPTRLDDAKKRVGDLIKQMKSSDVAMLVSFSDRANVEQPFTNDRRLLMRKLEAIKPTSRTSDLNGALRVATGLANPGRSSNAEDEGDTQVAEAKPATMYIMSDGGFRNTAKYSLGNLKPIYVKIGSDAPINYGITAFSTAFNPEIPDTVQAYGSIQNFSGTDVEIQTSLYLDGELKKADAITVPANKSGGVEFELTNTESGNLRLEIDNADQLALDNIAHAAINAPRRCRVLVATEGNDALQWALETEQTTEIANIDKVEPSYLQSEEFKKDQQGAYDLMIFDDCVPPSMPLCNTIFIGASKLTGRDGPTKKEDESKLLPGWKAAAKEEGAVIIDANLAHPIMRYVQTGDIRLIMESYPLTTPRGGSILIDTDVGPLVAIGPRDGYEDVVIAMNLVSRGDDGSTFYTTDWVARYGFPVFLNNAVRYLGGVSGEQSSIGSVQPGETISLRSSNPVDRVVIESPEGQKTTVRVSGNNDFVFAGTNSLGIYDVREGKNKETDNRFAVNLFDGYESQITPRATINTEYEEIEAERGWESTRREGWKYLLIGALVVLLVEWYIYNRRVYL